MGYVFGALYRNAKVKHSHLCDVPQPTWLFADVSPRGVAANSCLRRSDRGYPRVRIRPCIRLGYALRPQRCLRLLCTARCGLVSLLLLSRRHNAPVLSGQPIDSSRLLPSHSYLRKSFQGKSRGRRSFYRPPVWEAHPAATRGTLPRAITARGNDAPLRYGLVLLCAPLPPCQQYFSKNFHARPTQKPIFMGRRRTASAETVPPTMKNCALCGNTVKGNQKQSK